MGVQLEIHEDVAVLKLSGNFFGGSDTDTLRHMLTKLIGDGNRALVIHLGKVRRMNSMALGVLVNFHKTYRREGGRVILADLESIEDLLTVTRLARVFEIGPSFSDALRKLAA